MRMELHDGWTVRAVRGPAPDALADREVPATVPGCVHTDLLALDLIPDPYQDRNEAELHWIGRTDWRYRTTFDWEPGDGTERVDLACAGLDTIARLELNGHVIAGTANMHRAYRFDVTDQLRAGPNELTVTFTSALDHADRVRELLGQRPHTNHHPYNQIRKMACNFGWDWGPDLVTAGIWRPLALERWHGARLTSVRPLATVDADGDGVVHVHVDVDRAPGHDDELPVTVHVGVVAAAGVVPAGATTTTIEARVDQPRRWWPHGYGDQHRYPVDVALTVEDQPTPDNGDLTTWAGEVGFRGVRLDTEPDEHGTPFTFVVNDVPVFARGVNWIPDDCFPHRVDAARYRQRLAQARDAGVNLVRVWGGGIYESDDFYDACDELGILTWQDFLFACAAYPEEEPLRSEVEAEARDAITRLAPHPSLVLWNGNNENIWGHHDWGWRDQLGDRTWGAGYYHRLLPDLLAELDPTRPYSAGSPWSFSHDIHPNDPAHGATHIWDVWNQRDYTAYRDHVPRFVAEFGFQGPPAYATLRASLSDDPLRPDSPGMLAHQKAEDGNGKLARGLAEHFPEPQDFDDWFWATQLNQARALRFGVEHFRSHAPRCAGTVWWQLNDCWPVTSWSVVDGQGRRKPAWYALRAAYQDRLVTVRPRPGGLAAVLCNETDEPWTTRLVVARTAFAGAVLGEVRHQLTVPPRAVHEEPLPDTITTATDPAAELLVATAGDVRATWFHLPDLELALPVPELTTAVEALEDGYRVEVTAGTLVRDLALLADRVAPDAEVDDMLGTLLPGESTSIVVRTALPVDPEDLVAPLVLRSANQLLR
ncbi:glycoside hydrolase family 2 protein [Actinoalloteichus caeruleus]|uniref:glycoside hydrolase family 2 protein n=1 Tax=Actinoalloteichus cyanogriseus TaxID=2893586 RepID=UPI003BB8895B